MAVITTKPSTLTAPRYNISSLTDQDVYLFNEGNHFRIYEKLGAHLATDGNEPGVSFAVWAPNAREVSVMGEFNDWNPQSHPLQARGSSGIWEGFIPGIGKGALYKYKIHPPHNESLANKLIPLAV